MPVTSFCESLGHAVAETATSRNDGFEGRSSSLYSLSCFPVQGPARLAAPRGFAQVAQLRHVKRWRPPDLATLLRSQANYSTFPFQFNIGWQAGEKA